MNEWSLRFERNAICFPSGDQRGVSFSPSNSSSCSAFFFPSIGAIQRCFFAGQTTFFPSGETCRSSHPSLSHPISPSKRGSPPFTSAAHACCLGVFVRLCGFADVPSLLASLPRAYTTVLPSGVSRTLAICCPSSPVWCVTCRGAKSGEPASQTLRSPLLSKTQATHGACDALVRPYGNGELSTCSMVKLSPRQITGSDMLLTPTTRNWNNVFNTIAHYHRRTIARRLDSAEKWLNSFEKELDHDRW